MNEKSSFKYRLKMHPKTIDHLGVRLYDKASAVVAELIANAYDADAEVVKVYIPLGTQLAKKVDGEDIDNGFEIRVIDDGNGMTPQEALDFYLNIGADRREDKLRGNTSSKKTRRVMGRKGIGKLAPFGICKTIEIKSAGFEKKSSKNRVSHFILDYDEMMKVSIDAYYPLAGDQDQKTINNTGTTIRLSNFKSHVAPNKDVFHRQLARRFGIEIEDFKIKIYDTSSGKATRPFTIGDFDDLLNLKEGTKINLKNHPIKLNEEKSLPVSGWVALSKESFKNEDLAGIRIYARNRLYANTRDFGLKSGFQYELNIRAYAVGKVVVEWLDDDIEDLSQTGRQDILWSSEKGQALQKWGQEMLRLLAKQSAAAARKQKRDDFFSVSGLDHKIKEKFKTEELRKAATRLGKLFGGLFTSDDLKDRDYVNSINSLILSTTPHLTLLESLKELVQDDDLTTQKIMHLFKTAKISELASLGQVAFEKLQAIKKLKSYIKSDEPDERVYQDLLTSSPWLINPRWQPITSNQQLNTFLVLFSDWYEKQGGEDVSRGIDNPTKRPDFIFLDIGNTIEVVEIKPQRHVFNDSDANRFLNYWEALENFMSENKSFLDLFPNKFHGTIIREKEDVKDFKNKELLKRYTKERLLEFITWRDLMVRTEIVFRQFIEAANEL